jgi:hypothetical protein
MTWISARTSICMRIPLTQTEHARGAGPNVQGDTTKGMGKNFGDSSELNI